MNIPKTQLLKALTLWAVCFFGIGQWLFGCAVGPTVQHYEVYREQVKADTQVKLAIIEGYYRKEEADKVKKEQDAEEFFSGGEDVSGVELKRTLPLPEGDGHQSDIPCSVKCLDNCDDQCRIECPDLWAEMCGDDDFNIDDNPIGDAEENQQKEELNSGEKLDKEENGINAFASASGDNNNQTNIVGDGNRVIVQGGSGPNNNGPSPIEQAMADLLRGKVAPLKSSGEVIGEQVRGLISDTADAAVKVAPAVLTGVAINAASDAVVGISREAGDRYENSNNPDNSDNSITTTTEVTE